MIEILIFVVAVGLGWLVWKAKHQKKHGACCKHASGQHQAAVCVKNVDTPSAPIPPSAAESAEPALVASTPAPEPVVIPVTAPVTAAAVVVPPVTEEKVAIVPADSVLKRHYLATMQAESEAISNPYPSDSVLRRHYDALHKIETPQALASAVETPASQTTAPEPEQASACAKRAIPQDSVLYRHYLAQLRREIETELLPWPSDSVLKRHREQLLQARLQQSL